jgi:hypothetical protein
MTPNLRLSSTLVMWYICWYRIIRQKHVGRRNIFQNENSTSPKTINLGGFKIYTPQEP